MSAYDSSGKNPVLRRPGYTVSVERVAGRVFLHCDVHSTYTKAMKHQMLADMKMLASLGEPLFATHYSEQGEKHLKFLGMLGFLRVGTATDASGVSCEIFKHHG